MGHSARDYEDPARAASYGKRAGTTRAEERALVRLLGDAGPFRIVVDVPCGNGRLAPVLARLGAERLLGLDGAFAMARLAASAHGAAAVADVGAMPLADGSADVVLCVRLLHHFPERSARVRILKELSRVSRGPVVVSCYRLGTLEGLRRRFRPKRSSTRAGLSLAAMRGDAAAAGLRVVRVASLLPLVREQTFLLLCRTP